MQAKRLPFVSLVVLIGAVVVLIACGEASTPAAAVTGSVTVAPTAKPFTIGQQVKVGLWVVTINSVKTSTGDQFDTPKGIYLIIDASFQNTDSSSHTVSSFIQFNLTDSTGQKYNPQITGLSGITAPDGDVQAGKMVRGQTVWDVPVAQKHFEFSFADVAGNGATATWKLTVN